jgi:hypothetical protein
MKVQSSQEGGIKNRMTVERRLRRETQHGFNVEFEQVAALLAMGLTLRVRMRTPRSDRGHHRRASEVVGLKLKQAASQVKRNHPSTRQISRTKEQAATVRGS